MKILRLKFSDKAYDKLKNEISIKIMCDSVYEYSTFLASMICDAIEKGELELNIVLKEQLKKSKGKGV